MVTHTVGRLRDPLIKIFLKIKTLIRSSSTTTKTAVIYIGYIHFTFPNIVISLTINKSHILEGKRNLQI